VILSEPTYHQGTTEVAPDTSVIHEVQHALEGRGRIELTVNGPFELQRHSAQTGVPSKDFGGFR